MISSFSRVRIALPNRKKLATQKMKFCIKDFFNKCEQICRKLWICSHLLKKLLMENFIFCAVTREYILSFISCSSEKELNKLEVQGENGQQFTRYFTRPTSEKPNQADGNPLSPAEDPLELNTQVIKLYRGDHSSKYFVLTKVS